MAYKFSRGIYKHSGSLTAEHGAAVDQGGLTVSAGVSALQSVTATVISGSGNLRIGGDARFAQGITASAGLTASADVYAPAFHGALDAAAVQTHISVSDSSELDFSYAAGVVSADLKAGSIANSKLVNDSVTVAGHEVALGASISLDTGDISEGTNLYWTVARGESMFDSKMAAASTDDLAEGEGNLYYTDARVQAAVSAGEGLHYDGAGQFSLSSSVAGAGLAFAGGVLSVDTAEIAAGLSGSVESIVKDFIEASDFVTFDDATGTISIDAAAFTGSANAAFDAQLATKSTDDLAEGSNLYWTVARGESMFDSKLAAADTGDLAEGENLYWTVARGESMFDSKLAAADTGDLAEGSNLYWTVARGESMFDSKLAAADTGDLAEGSNLYYTDARARAAVSVTDNGGDGSLSYDSATGVISYTGPSASEVRAHLSAGAGLAVADGEFSVNVDDSSIEINSDSLRVKAAGITNAMLAGSIENAKLVNSAVTVAGTAGEIDVDGGALALGGTVTLGLSDTITGNRSFTGTVSINNLNVTGTMTVVNTTQLQVKDALVSIASGSSAFQNDTGLEFGVGGNVWASLKTAQVNIDGVTGLENVLSSSLPLVAPQVSANSFYGNLVGTMQLSYEAVSLNHTISKNVTAATANVTLTLPSSPVVGQEHRIKCKVADGSNPAVIIQPQAGGATIDGDSVIVLESFGAGVSLVWDGANWMVF